MLGCNLFSRTCTHILRLYTLHTQEGARGRERDDAELMARSPSYRAALIINEEVRLRGARIQRAGRERERERETSMGAIYAIMRLYLFTYARRDL